MNIAKIQLIQDIIEDIEKEIALNNSVLKWVPVKKLKYENSGFKKAIEIIKKNVSEEI